MEAAGGLGSHRLSRAAGVNEGEPGTLLRTDIIRERKGQVGLSWRRQAFDDVALFSTRLTTLSSGNAEKEREPMLRRHYIDELESVRQNLIQMGETTILLLAEATHAPTRF
jgi:hypothetical protein